MVNRGLLSYIELVIHVVIPSGFIFAFLSNSVSTEAVLYSIRPASAKQYRLPFAAHYGVGYLNSDLHLKQKEPVYFNHAPVPRDNILQIEASDAIDSMKYSQPDVSYSLFNLNSGVKVPSSSFLKQKLLQTSAQNLSPENFQDHTFSNHASENSMKPMRDIRYLDSAVDEGAKSETDDLDYKLENNLKNMLQTHTYDQNIQSKGKNNFTDLSDDIVYVSSDAVLSYEAPSTELNDSYDNSSIKQNLVEARDVPSLNSSNINSSIISLVTNALSEYTTQNSISSNTHVDIEFVNQTDGYDSIVSSSVFPSTNNDSVASSLPSTDSEKKLSSGTVAGIVIAVLVSVTLLSSAVIYLLYRKFNGKCTSVVESKFNTDNCGYLDDSLRSSIYLNNHIELPKESSEEMTSLDNDSFLNSLETMTIQNYWADNSKNTKV